MSAQYFAAKTGGKSGGSSNLWSRLFEKKAPQGGYTKMADENYKSEKSQRSSFFSLSVCESHVEGKPKVSEKSAALPLYQHLLPGSFNRHRSNA